MLKQEQAESIAKLLKLDPAKFVAALKDQNEVEVELPTGIKVFSESELQARDTNVKSTGYNEGVVAGKEMLVKEMKQEHGITAEGKEAKTFIDAFKAKVLSEAKLAPNEALKEKETIIANLQANVQNLTLQKTQVETELKKVQLNGNLYKQVPELGVPMEADEVILSMQQRGYSFDADENGNIVPKLNGQVIRDQATQNPLAAKDVISGYVKERKWEKVAQEGPKGRGAGNSSPAPSGNATKLSEVEREWKEAGKSINGAEFQAHVEKLAKENAEFDLNG